MNRNYRPTKADLDSAETMRIREFLDGADNGPPPSDEEWDFIDVVAEAWRIGTEDKAATVGEALDSLIRSARDNIAKRTAYGISVTHLLPELDRLERMV